MSRRQSNLKLLVLAGVAAFGLDACSENPDVHGSVSVGVGYSSGYYGGGYYGGPCCYYGGGYPPAVIIPPGNRPGNGVGGPGGPGGIGGGGSNVPRPTPLPAAAPRMGGGGGRRR